MGPLTRPTIASVSRAAPGLAILSLLVTGPFLAAATAEPARSGPARQQQGQGFDPASFPGLEGWSPRYDEALLEAETGALVFTGYVDIENSVQQVRLQADRVRIDPETLIFQATGNVTFQHQDLLIRGREMTGDLDDGTGEILDAQGIGPDDIYFRGERIIQLEPGKYRIERGVVSPCAQALPIWEFSARTITLEPDDHATMILPLFKVKSIPLLALPALYYPIDEDGRSTGFLLPGIGTSTNRGFMVSESFFWAIHRSADATFTVENYSKAGLGVGAEFRHALAAGAQGRVRVYRLEGTRLTADELAAGAVSVPQGWTVDASHQQPLPGRFRLAANANFFTSQEFVQGFEDNFNRFLRRTSSAGAFLTRTWDAYNLNIVGDSERTFFGRDSVLRQRLPEVEFRVRSKPLVGPMYFDFQGSAARLIREEQDDGAVVGGAYSRLDAFPELSVNFTRLPWLTFSPFAAWRSTYYSHRVEQQVFEPDPVLRHNYATGIQVVGPSFFRIFDTPTSSYSPRYKHVIQPRIVWSRSEELDFEGRIIGFDEIDRFGRDSNRMTVSLTSRLLSKRFPSPNSEQRSVWETFSVEIAREFDLDPPADQEFPTLPLPYRITSRFTPTRGVNFSGGVEFTPDLEVGGYNVSGDLTSPDAQAGITWFRTVSAFPDPDDPSKVALEARNRLTGRGQVDLFGNAVTLRGHTSVDITARELQEVAFAGQWNTQCCSIGGQFRNISFAFRDEQQFSLILEFDTLGSLGFGSDQR